MKVVIIINYRNDYNFVNEIPTTPYYLEGI